MKVALKLLYFIGKMEKKIYCYFIIIIIIIIIFLIDIHKKFILFNIMKIFII